MKYNLFISPCPNDTFIFSGLASPVQGQHFQYRFNFYDIEELNIMALAQEPGIIKVSAAIYPQLTTHYRLLETGAAFGKGVGPLLVGKNDGDQKMKKVAVPGKYTTASFLFRSAYPDFGGEVIEMRFDKIMNAVANGEVDAGVIIHESRFEYSQYGLSIIEDLGTLWEDKTNLPIPLGIIVAHKDIDEDDVLKIQQDIRASLDRAWEQYPELDAMVGEHAQEMNEETMMKHIQLYVNEYTMSLNEDAKKALFTMEKLV